MNSKEYRKILGIMAKITEILKILVDSLSKNKNKYSNHYQQSLRTY